VRWKLASRRWERFHACTYAARIQVLLRSDLDGVGAFSFASDGMDGQDKDSVADDCISNYFGYGHFDAGAREGGAA
jgi:hypothetical protein